jgi:hypothetical protein
MKGMQALAKTLRRGWGILALVAAMLAPAGSVFAITYTSGDVWYVAYQSPTGPNYIVNLGSRDQFLTATSTLTFPDVLASDLNGVIGASAPNIWVGFFGVLTTARDGILSANGPLTDFDVSSANIIGAANQIDSFGAGVVNNALAVPSGNIHAGKFASSASTGSYQSTLNAVNQGSLGNNVQWNVETQLSNAGGTRISTPVQIPFYKAIRNPFVGTLSHSVIGFLTLNPNGTITYSPDADGDLIADNVDLCPGVYNFGDNSDTDGDGHAPACDCNPADGTAWSIPGEAAGVTFTTPTDFAWSAPSSLGGTAAMYDVIRALQSVVGSAPGYGCFQPNLPGLTSSDGTSPAVSGGAYLYLIRAGNTCGEGTAGVMSNLVPRTVPACP